MNKFVNDEVKLVASIIAFVIIFSCGAGLIDFLIKNRYQNQQRLQHKNQHQHGHVFLLTPSGKINLGDYKGEYSANKNVSVWIDKNGSKHMTTAAVEFVEDKKK